MKVDIAEVLDRYKNVVIDATFCDCDISDELWESLHSLKIWVAETFDMECEALSKLIKNDSDRERFLKTVEKINREFNKRELCASREELSETATFKVHNDTFGLSSFISSAFPNQAIVLTTNEILIEQIVLSGIAIDIFDLNNNLVIYSSEYESLKANYYISMPSPPVDHGITIKEGTVLTTGKYDVTLGKIFHGGGAEGRIYRVIGPDGNEYKTRLAKILLPRRSIPEKLQNIEDLHRLAQKGNCDWATLPYDVLYLPDTHQSVGYIQRLIEDAEVIGNDAQYLGDLSDPDCDLARRVSETLDLCIKITRQIVYLNRHGVLVFDFNTDNFVYPKTDDGEIIIWDTDSWGYKHYIANVAAPNSSVTREYDLSNKNDCIQCSYDKLYQGIFNLLTLGDNALDEDTMEYLYLNSEYHSYFRRSFIPENVMRLFDDVFAYGYPFSAEALLAELMCARNRLQFDPETDRTYQVLCGRDMQDLSENFADEETDTNNGRVKKRNHTFLWPIVLVAVIIFVFVLWYFVTQPKTISTDFLLEQVLQTDWSVYYGNN